MTIEALIDKVDKLEPVFKSNNKSLEEYWRSMYSLAVKHKNENPTLELFYKLIEESLVSSPVELKPEWLNLTKAPRSNFFDKDLENDHSEITSEVGAFDFFLEVLEFQIAELYKMKNKQLLNDYKYLGIDSETGNRWFNFDLIDILDCGLSGMSANGYNEDLKSWIFLGEIIEMGRIYE